MKVYRIVETDSFGGDYPGEKFVSIPSGRKEQMEFIATAINNTFCRDDSAPRFWKVVDEDYQLVGGFEP